MAWTVLNLPCKTEEPIFHKIRRENPQSLYVYKNIFYHDREIWHINNLLTSGHACKVVMQSMCIFALRFTIPFANMKF